MKAIKLESERLLLLPLSLEHLSEDYVFWLNDLEVNKYLETRGDYTLEKLENFLKAQEKKQILFWGIHLKTNNKHIGNIKIDPIDVENKSGEYGILMGDKTQWRKGYAKEVSKRVISYCFNDLQLKQITLGVVEDNINAIKLYEKLGFLTYAIKENFGQYNNKWSNCLRMKLENDQ